MKRWLNIIGILVFGFIAFWVYSNSAKTRAARIELNSIQSEIRKEHERISVLRAEWAYLNRPERLRHLVELNFDKLGLVQITEQNYGDTASVPLAPQNGTEPLTDIDDAELSQILSEVESESEEANE